MELSFNALKKLQVVSLNDGKNLGRVCDVLIIYPENCVKGFYVTGGRGFKFMRDEQFVPWGDIAKLGEDVILIKSAGTRPQKGACPPPPPPRRRDVRRDNEDYE